MKNHIALTLLAVLAFAIPASQGAPNKVVRPAPDFFFSGAGGKTSSLKSLRGQPVVLLVAPSPRDRTFRRQVKNAEELYRRFAAQHVIFVAAFSDTSGAVASDIPFTVAQNGPQIASAYGAGRFGLFIIGPDGNLDLASAKTAPAERLREVIGNSFQVQSAQRKR